MESWWISCPVYFSPPHLFRQWIYPQYAQILKIPGEGWNLNCSHMKPWRAWLIDMASCERQKDRPNDDNSLTQDSTLYIFALRKWFHSPVMIEDKNYDAMICLSRKGLTYLANMTLGLIFPSIIWGYNIYPDFLKWNIERCEWFKMCLLR